MAFCVSARAGLQTSLINHSGDFVTSKQYARAVNPRRLQILRIDREGIKDDVISHGV